MQYLSLSLYIYIFTLVQCWPIYTWKLSIMINHYQQSSHLFIFIWCRYICKSLTEWFGHGSIGTYNSREAVGEDGRHEERDQESESGGAKNADFPLIPLHRKILSLMFHTILITRNFKILKFLYTHVSGQTIATSHDLTPKGSCLEGEIIYFRNI